MRDYLLGVLTIPAIALVGLLLLLLPALWHRLGRMTRVITAWDRANPNTRGPIYDSFAAIVSAAKGKPHSVRLGSRTLIFVPAFNFEAFQAALDDLRVHGIRRPIDIHIAVPAAAPAGPPPATLPILEPAAENHRLGALVSSATRLRAFGFGKSMLTLVTPGDPNENQQALIALQHHAHLSEPTND